MKTGGFCLLSRNTAESHNGNESVIILLYGMSMVTMVLPMVTGLETVSTLEGGGRAEASIGDNSECKSGWEESPSRDENSILGK